MEKEKITLDDLIKISEFHKGRDMDILAEGGSFYENEDGFLSGCFNFPEEIRFLGLNVYKEGVPRGNHYHYNKVEYTYVLSGEIKAEFYLVNDPSQKKEIILKAGQMAHFLPRHHHTLTAINGNAIAIEASPQVYDKEDYYK